MEYGLFMSYTGQTVRHEMKEPLDGFQMKYLTQRFQWFMKMFSPKEF